MFWTQFLVPHLDHIPGEQISGMKNLHFYIVENLPLALRAFSAGIGLTEDVNPYADLRNLDVCVATHFITSRLSDDCRREADE